MSKESDEDRDDRGAVVLQPEPPARGTFALLIPIHTPTDSQGRRRYFKQWHFDGGQIALLRHEAGGWTSVDPTPLGPSEGTFHDGYTPLVLRHGLHAGVLLAPDGGGDEAWFQPYLAPCP